MEVPTFKCEREQILEKTCVSRVQLRCNIREARRKVRYWQIFLCINFQQISFQRDNYPRLRSQRWQTTAYRGAASRCIAENESRAKRATRCGNTAMYSRARARVEALEKGSLYTRHRVHILGVTMKQQVAAPPNLYDRLCNLDGPCNPPFQPFATGHFTAANEWLPFTSLPLLLLSFFFLFRNK